MRLTTLSQEVRRTAFQPVKSEEHQHHLVRWLVLGAVYLVTVMLTAPFYLYKPPASEARIKEGELPLRAEADFRFTPAKAEENWRQERSRYSKRIFNFVPTASDRVRANLETFFQAVATLDPAQDSPQRMIEQLTKADQRFNFPTTEDVVDFVRICRDPRFRQAIDAIVDNAYRNYVVVKQPTMYEGFRKDRILEVNDPSGSLTNRREILDNPLPYPPDWFTWNPLFRRLDDTYGPDVKPEVHRTAEQLLSAVLEPDLVLNDIATKRAFDTYPHRDLSVRYQQGAALLTKDLFRQGLDDETLRLLQAHRAAVQHRHNVRLLGHACFVAIVFLILAFYVRRFSREFAFTTYNVMLVSLPVLIALGLEAIVILLADGNPGLVGYLFPAGAIGLLGVLLLDVRMALLLVTWGCLLMGLQADLNYQFVVVGLFGGYTAVAALSRLRKRWEVFVASVLIGFVNTAVILITGFIQNPADIPFGLAGLGFFSGIASFLVLAILPVFERFGILTDMQLLELTGLHHPLLRQMEELAPGTWQHTLNVTKLAEAAATEIGVNYLLVRGGCYFHDIGKVKKPEYFTENQITAEDKMRHAALKPIMSTLIIKNHVKEGVEMAKAAKLPQRIIDFIPQHHGTSLISYFYNKAQETQDRGESKEPLREDDYRYPGPKPQTIEAAIVMLADSVEATATARLTGRTVRLDDIQQLVRNTVLDRFNDGQFNECNLTLRDLNIIRQVFVTVLKSRFHTRIDYPKKGEGVAAKEKKEKKPEAPLDKDKDEKEPPSGSRTSVATAAMKPESRASVAKDA